jgi:SAM-dependent methyltransferase
LPVIGPLFKRGPIVFGDGVRYGDIVKGLPLPDNSADAVYASHVLEHLDYHDFWKALENTYRVLKSGGRFRLIVPDLELRAPRYIEALDRGDDEANSEFMRRALLGSERRPRGLNRRLRHAFGNAYHLWMWDEQSMGAALRKTGFVNVRRCSFGDSGDPRFDAVEERGRFFDERCNGDECAMEAWKPAS